MNARSDSGKYRVIQWGAGFVGSRTLRYLLQSDDLELVGLKCVTDEKVGVDAGELAGTGPSGVRATQDAKALLDLNADCVVYMPRDPYADPSVDGNPSRVWMDELIGILEHGQNVVTALTAGTHYKHLANGDKFRDELEAACQKGKSTVFFTGFNPGFTNVIAHAMSSAVGEIKRIDTWGLIEWGSYTVPETLQALGFGARPEDLPVEIIDSIRLTTWGGVPYVLADGLGVEVERLEMNSENYLAEEAFTAPGGLRVEKGTVAAYRFTISGIVDGSPLLNVSNVNCLDPDRAPADWPSLGNPGGYLVEIDSTPPFRGEFPMRLDDAMTMTGARCVNAIGATVDAEPGYKTFLDLPTLGGRFGIDRRSRPGGR